MAYTTIDDPEAYFQVKTYTGNSTDDTAITLDGTNNLQPDMVWFKSRSAAINHVLVDSVRGVTKYLTSNDTSGEATVSDALKSFDSDGFTLDEDATTSSAFVNGTGKTYVTWCWKANGTGSSNTTGSINTTATSANTTSGFSIITYTGNGTSGATIGHGLGVAPTFIALKNRSMTGGAAEPWRVYHDKNTSAPATDYLALNTTAATADDANAWNDTAPSSTLITLGNGGASNQNTETYVAYAFADVQGFSKFGSYTGNGSSSGPFCFCGFRPKLVITKMSSGLANWVMKTDGVGDADNPQTEFIYASATAAEGDGSHMDFLSNGFKWRDAATNNNQDGSTYVYIAFAEAPFVNSEGIPCNAR